MAVPPPTAGPGWYPDPNGLGVQRWWDGRKWTEHVGPEGQELEPPTRGIGIMGWFASDWKRTAVIALVAVVAVAAAIGGEPEEEAAQPQGRTPHQQDIYDQQRGVCRTEQQYNTIEYREQNGDSDPLRYAEYAAEHGFYEVRDAAERQAAIDGCLAGLRP